MTEKSAGADHSTDDEAARNAGRFSRLYLDALRGADAAGAFRVASRALGQGMALPVLYHRVVVPAMHEIGALWEKGAITVADEHAATELTHQVLAALRSPTRFDFAGGTTVDAGRGLVLLATVEGERHALGLRMAADLFEEAGYRVVYLGADVPTDALLQSVSSFSPDLLALSVTMPELASVLEEASLGVLGRHPDLNLLVGGQASTASHGTTKVRDLESLPEEIAAL